MRNIIFLLPLLISCSLLPKQKHTVPSETETEEMVNQAIESYSIIEETATEEENLSLSETEATKPPAKKDRKLVYELLPKELNSRVKKWVRYYSVKDRERFQRFLNRGAKYKEVIEDLLVENSLPPDLYYLGIIESGYSTGAISRVGAVGPWQFMRPTAREYGLKVNYYVDERRDPIRSTESAIKYLRWLYKRKGSWNLALAAYNAGPGTVRRAMRRGKSKDYWRLTKKRLLPRDTREYVSQFLAALTIGRNLEKFGFHEQTDIDYPDVELVDVPSPTKLKDISRITGVSVASLKEVNPHLTKGLTPPDDASYELWVPTEYVSKFKGKDNVFIAAKIKGLKPRRYLADSSGIVRYRVRRGQTLSHIARRFGLSVAYLKKINGMKSSRIYAGQRIRVKSRSYRRSHTYHVVRSGQNLGGIARRYRLSISELKRLNQLRSNKILIGQRLRVKSRSIAPSRSLAKIKGSHTVRNGENLGLIARKYKMSVSQLKNANELRSNRIYPGQKLRVKNGPSKKVNRKTASSNKIKNKKYRVRRGDNLTKIASNFGLTLRQIKKKNRLKSSRIYPGQILQVGR